MLRRLLPSPPKQWILCITRTLRQDIHQHITLCIDALNVLKIHLNKILNCYSFLLYHLNSSYILFLAHILQFCSHISYDWFLLLTKFHFVLTFLLLLMMMMIMMMISYQPPTQMSLYAIFCLQGTTWCVQSSSPC